MKLIIASNNKGKIREYKDIFEPLGFRVFSQSEENIRLEVEETGSTFEQNAILKARAIYELAHCCVVSDDSGLEADAVYQMADGRYALIEIKTGANAIPSAEKGLLKFYNLIKDHNRKAEENISHPKPIYREPSLLIIICANAPIAYTTENGDHVVPVGCLKD